MIGSTPGRRPSGVAGRPPSQAPAAPGREHPDGPRQAERAERDAELDALAARLAACTDPEEERKLREELVLLALPVAAAIASRYGLRGDAAEDVLQAARLGLVKAAGRFDATVGVGFLAFAVPTMTGEVKRYFRDHSWVIRPPRRVQELRSEVEHASMELTQQLDRSPTVGEIATHLRLDEEAVIECLSASDYFSPRSLDAPLAGSEHLTVADTVGGEDPALDLVVDLEALKPLLAQLSPRDRRMLARRFFDEWSQERIGDEVGVTQMQVSRLLTRTLTRLRSQIDPDGGREPEPEPRARRRTDRR
jgi:RNA polymerase sigma-B factor